MTPASVAELSDLVRAQCEATALEWLDGAADAVRRDPAALGRLFPAVGRHVGRAPLRPPTNGTAAAGAAGRSAVGDDPTQAGPAGVNSTGRGTTPGERATDVVAELGWTVDDAARVLLLVAAGGEAWAHLDDLYRYGDAAERRAVLRALAHLPPDGEAEAEGVGLALVEDALRSNDPRLLAAALGPYGVERLADEAFNQAVLKCVFVGVPLAALPGDVGRRASPTLARMLAAYVRERVAAGRDVPDDVWPLIESHPPLEELAAVEVELTHPLRSRRQAAAAALGQRSAHLRNRAPGSVAGRGGGR